MDEKDLMEQYEKTKRMRLSSAEAETLPYEESYYRKQLKTIESEKTRYERAGNGLVARLSSKRAAGIKAKLTELEGARIEAKKRLEYIEKRKRDDSEAKRALKKGRVRTEVDRARTDIEWRKRRAQMDRESAEIQRQAERQEKTREKWGGMRDDLRVNRLIKRRR